MTLLLSNTTVEVRTPVGADSHGWSSDTYVGLNPPRRLSVSIQPQSEFGNTSAARSDGYSAGPGSPGVAEDALGYADPSATVAAGDHWITEEGETWLVRSVVLVRGPISPDLDVKRATLSLVTP